jgi:hypothetical protein
MRNTNGFFREPFVMTGSEAAKACAMSIAIIDAAQALMA